MRMPSRDSGAINAETRHISVERGRWKFVIIASAEINFCGGYTNKEAASVADFEEGLWGTPNFLQ